jgi:hypothetical protein
MQRQTSRGLAETRIEGSTVVVYLAGERIGALQQAPLEILPVSKRPAGYTHYLATDGSKGSPVIALTTAEADQVVAEWHQSRQAESMSLETQREWLVAGLAGAKDAQVAASEEALGNEGAEQAVRAHEAHEDAVNTARAQLAEFDYRHPEIEQAIIRERRAAAERGMWR